MIRFFLYLFVPVTVLLASCGSTPEKRIERNPQLFQRLSSNEQKLVRAGKISQGMSKPAVFLAMGNPDHKTSGIQHGENFERWHYNTMVPVYSYGVSPYYRYNYGRYGRYSCRRNYGGIGFQPTVQYVPRHGASVEFVKDVVTEWNRSGR